MLKFAVKRDFLSLCAVVLLHAKKSIFKSVKKPSITLDSCAEVLLFLSQMLLPWRNVACRCLYTR